MVGEEVKKLHQTFIVEGHVKWYSHLEESVTTEKLSIQLPDNSANELSGIYPREVKTCSHSNLLHECSGKLYFIIVSY